MKKEQVYCTVCKTLEDDPVHISLDSLGIIGNILQEVYNLKSEFKFMNSNIWRERVEWEKANLEHSTPFEWPVMSQVKKLLSAFNKIDTINS